MLDTLKKYSYQIIIGLILILGFIIRTNLFLSSNVFEDDECRLVITMLDKNLWQMFLPLGDAQSAPPIFMFCSKILANLFGYKERVLHFLPYITSVASLWVFYKVCKNYFSKKITTAIGLFLFSVNLLLIYFSFTFKQYSLDVLVALVCVYYFPKIDIKNLDVKKMIGLSVSLILLPLISLPSLFFIAGLFISNLISDWKNKEFYKKSLVLLLPFLLVMGLYYWFVLLPSKIDLDYYFPNYWEDGFLTLSISSLLKLILFNLRFLFAPNKLVLFPFILFLWGVVTCFLDKTETRKTSYLLVGTLAMAIVASLLKLYPIAGRVILYLTGVFILLILRPLELSKNKKAFLPILLVTVLGFVQYSPAYLYRLRNDNEMVKYAPESLMQILIKKFNPDKDMILCNSASVSSYLFYSSRNKFYTDNVRNITRLATKDIADEYFDGLKKNQRYWFYLIKDYGNAEEFPFILKNINKRKVLYYKKDRESMLIYVQN